MKLTYEMIKPILVRELSINDNQIKVEFKADNQPKILSATAFVPDTAGINQQTKDKIRQKAIVEAFRTLIIFYDYDEEQKRWIFKSPY